LNIQTVAATVTTVWIFNLNPQQLVGPGAAVDVPDIVGQAWETETGEVGDGQQELLDAGLASRVVQTANDEAPKGQILGTTPAAGTTVEPGFEITVTVSSGPPLVSLPSLTYKSEEEAQAAIEAAGLVYGTTSVSYSPTVPGGVVVGLQRDGDTDVITGAAQLQRGTTVNLLVSNGLVNVPDVKGQPVQQAQATLAGGEYQLIVRPQPDRGCSGGAVTGQSAIGETPQKSEIRLTYCAG